MTSKPNHFLIDQADSGNVLAQFQLGQLYEYGKDNLPQDFQRAHFWYKKAADQGYPPAFYCIGMFYEHGRGVPKDLAMAADYYQKGADENDPWAQNNLGFLYSHGKGVPGSHDKAMYWYKKAAEQGHFPAQFNIGVRYAGGQGMPVDLVEAHFWIDRALYGARSELHRERARRTLSDLVDHMSEEEVESAKKKMAGFLQSPPLKI